MKTNQLFLLNTTSHYCLLKSISHVNALWQGVEWDWYTQGGKEVLYWHWSPRVGLAMNFEFAATMQP